ncbi:leucine carboxyl methyltransferase [Periconia macrospinosa]|uniref:Leucine carboxyl methyltransferase 1 n=1 Tax=Periconia macrospinosa TaxID=97972 RepID=A0A2V1DUJ6_9PLEO|nr:leucine carboxyl methyltransferase [Periconia macrospinosa]
MAAREIPDLKTLLASRRGGGLRGRGRGRGGLTASSPGGSETIKDSAVRGTDQDAAGSRVSCVELGYLNDAYASLFATQSSTRRLPLLNRGTYVRTSAIDQLVNSFLKVQPNAPKQIISLGAGTDTRYFRLRDAYPSTTILYHEIDFPTNTAAKLNSIRRHAQLYEKLLLSTHPLPPPQSSSYHSPTYNLHALDLRSLTTTTTSSSSSSSSSPPETTPSPQLPQLPNLDPNLPTLILSEMCLIYLQPSAVSTIIQKFTTHYLSPSTPASLILYEPILPNDAFGRTMISNLATRNIHLPTLTAYPELGDQRARLKQYGFVAGAKAADTEFIWREWVSAEEKERVAGLEMLDELEELDLLLRHYCVAWGYRDGATGGDDDDAHGNIFSQAWAHVKEQG